MSELKHNFFYTFFLTAFLLIIIKDIFQVIYSIETIELMYIPVLAFFVGVISITKSLIKESQHLTTKR